jgi:hypothetical protein
MAVFPWSENREFELRSFEEMATAFLCQAEDWE